MPTATVPVPGVGVLLSGAPAANELMWQLLDVQVRDSTHAPATALLRFRDPEGTLVDDDRLLIGTRLELRFSQRDTTQTVSLFKGEVVALEPEFTESDCIVAVRAYDLSWRLNRRRTSRTFKDVAPEDIIERVAKAVGIDRGDVKPSNARYEFFQQSMETDWEFCRRIATQINRELVVEDGKFNLRPRTQGAPGTTLTWGDQLLAFKPRMSGLGQVSRVTVANGDPATRSTLTGVASEPSIPHRSTAVDSRGAAVQKLGNQEVVIADRVVESQAEANELAQTALDRLAGSFVEGEGRAWGDPAIRAGATVKLEKVGRFSGEYVLSETTHRYSGGSGYVTSFVISGRGSYALSDLVRRDSADWASSLVIGIVSNNKDDKKLGRVKVKFPALGDNIESGWARVLTANAGKDGRGMYYLPQIDDEVVVAFEHGDTRRPLILGSLFNGRDTVPPELIDDQAQDPKFGVKTPHEVYVESTQKMTLRSGETLIVEVTRTGRGGTGDVKIDAEGTITVSAAQQVTIKGPSGVKIESNGPVSLAGSVIDIKSNGAVNIQGATINLG